jgi:hypothetical protein
LGCKIKNDDSKVIQGDENLFQNSSGDSEGNTPRGRKLYRFNQALKM